MEYKFKNITLRTVNHDDLNEVAKMWNFGKGENAADVQDKKLTSLEIQLLLIKYNIQY